MGQRYVISVTKNDLKTKLDVIKITLPSILTARQGPGAEQAPSSCHLVILKITCVYWFGALPFEIALHLDEPIKPSFLADVS